jgi:hypothetical protein
MRANACRYDVIYGSSGFNSIGYNGGCEFANGTLSEALASPPAARYLCGPEDANQYRCTADHVASAFCFAKIEVKTNATGDDGKDYTTYKVAGDYLLDYHGDSEGWQDLTEVRCCLVALHLLLSLWVVSPNTDECPRLKILVRTPWI